MKHLVVACALWCATSSSAAAQDGAPPLGAPAPCKEELDPAKQLAAELLGCAPPPTLPPPLAAPTTTDAQTLTPPLVPPAVNVPPTPPAALAPTSEGSCGDRALCLQHADVAIWPRAALRFGYELVQADPDVAFLGRHDGFRLDQVRVGVETSYGDVLFARVRVDGARLLPGTLVNEPVSPLVTALVDAFVTYAPSPWFTAAVGQQRMPTDREDAAEEIALVFASRSVASSGVAPGRGFVVQGLSVGRELGVVVASQQPRLGPVILDYGAGLANGNGVNNFGNDDEWPAAFARMGAAFAFNDDDAFGLAAGAHLRPRLVGDIPVTQSENEAGGFVEASLQLAGFDAAVVLHGQRVGYESVFADPTDPAQQALGSGAVAWLVVARPLGMDLYGFSAGLRGSVLDPAVSFTDDVLVEGSLGLRWDPPFAGLPVALILDLTTLATVDAAGIRETRNRAFVLAQLDL